MRIAIYALPQLEDYVAYLCRLALGLAQFSEKIVDSLKVQIKSIATALAPPRSLPRLREFLYFRLDEACGRTWVALHAL